MSVYNLIEYINVYSKTSESLRQYYKDEPALNNKNIIDFLANNNTITLFKIKQEVTGESGSGSIKDVKIIVSSKYLRNFWRSVII